MFSPSRAEEVHFKFVEGEEKPKVALITGITGQDGSYLAELLLSKNYIVHGIVRRSSSFNTGRIDHLAGSPRESTSKIKSTFGEKFFLHHGDLTDSSNLTSIIAITQPDEIYNLAAQSHVKVSFSMSEYTAETDALGFLRILNSVIALGLDKKTRIYQASTSELYGMVQEVPQTEKTPFYPRSPYAVAKQYAYWIGVNYREAYNLYVCNGILFNHESPRRGPTFVTHKITLAVAKISLGLQDVVILGNLSAQRDWGHAKDYVEAMWLMLQQNQAEDFVVATGETHPVREFCELAFAVIGKTLTWEGEGIDEVGKDQDGVIRVKVDEQYFRPTEVDLLIGDPKKAKEKLGWQPTVGFKELVTEMVQEDIKALQKK